MHLKKIINYDHGSYLKPKQQSKIIMNDKLGTFIDFNCQDFYKKQKKYQQNTSKKANDNIISVNQESLNQRFAKQHKPSTIGPREKEQQPKVGTNLTNNLITSSSLLSPKENLFTQKTNKYKKQMPRDKLSNKMLVTLPAKTTTNSNTFFYSLILQLILVFLVLTILIDNHAVCAMSKRFLKGFIMGAMFAHHHKP